MRRIITLTTAFLMCAFISVNAQNEWSASISATDYTSEGDGIVWIAGSGFDYAWDGVAPAHNIFSNERDSIVLLIDGYTECIGDVNISLGRMGLHNGGWAFLDPQTKYYNGEDGIMPALTKDDFDENGQLQLTFVLPAGTKPAVEYTENTAETPTLWLFQVVGTNSNAEHECGESYCNFIIDVSEELTGREVVVEPNAISNVKMENLSLYPNPVERGEMVTVDAIGAVEVYSLTGAKVLESETNEFSSADLGAGIYMVKAEGNKISKLIVK